MISSYCYGFGLGPSFLLPRLAQGFLFVMPRFLGDGVQHQRKRLGAMRFLLGAVAAYSHNGMKP